MVSCEKYVGEYLQRKVLPEAFCKTVFRGNALSTFDGTPLFGNPFETIEKEQLDKSFLRLTELLNETQSKRNLG